MNKRNCLLFAVTVLIAGIANAQESVRLTDVIKSSGAGNVDFFKDVTAEQLEQLRLDNGGSIVIGVDVNESANGTEKAATQAVTLGALTLTVTYSDNTQKVYDLASGCCTTETQALVAEAPDTLRLPHYTLLGESGSSRITANNTIQGNFDSTIKLQSATPFSTRLKASRRPRSSPVLPGLRPTRTWAIPRHFMTTPTASRTWPC